MKYCTLPSGLSLVQIYRQKAGDYPKFFKMDTLSRLGFLLTEMLVADDPNRFMPRQDRAVLVFSREGCVANDLHYVESVYTLPNIVAGEVCIRNKYAGESSAFVLEQFDEEKIFQMVRLSFQDPQTRSAIVIWADCPTDNEWDARAWLVEKEDLL